jgi:dienelactone hydrolase
MRVLALLTGMLLLMTSARAEIITKELAYTHDGVQLKGFLAYDDAAAGQRPGVLVIHEWWGRNEYVQDRARQLAELGYIAFAIDMYGEGKIATTAEEARGLATPFYQDRSTMRARVQAGLDVLRQQEHVDKDRIAAVGYCFGGSVALELARSGADVAGVVSFHGGLSTPNPEDARNIKGKVMVANGAVDPMVKDDERIAFRKEMEDAKVDYIFIEYAGAVHSFTSPAASDRGIPGVAYDQTADRRSWRHMRDFLNEIFAEDAR